MMLEKMRDGQPFGMPMQEAPAQAKSPQDRVREVSGKVINAYENLMSDRLNLHYFNALERSVTELNAMAPDERKEAAGRIESLAGIKIDVTGVKFLDEMHEKTRLETVVADYFTKDGVVRGYTRTVNSYGFLYKVATNKMKRLEDLARGGWLQSEKELAYISNAHNDSEFEKRLGIVKNYENERIQGFPGMGNLEGVQVTFPSYLQYREYLADKYTPGEAKSLVYGFSNSGSVVGKTLALRLSSYSPIIDKAAAKYGIDKNLVYAVIAQESGGNPRAESWCGAKGLMQLMDATASDMGVQNSFDPAQNIEGGVKYLEQLMAQYKDEKLALVAYNAGPKNAAKYIATGWLPQETSNYVPRVMSFYEQFKDGKLALNDKAKNSSAAGT